MTVIQRKLQSQIAHLTEADIAALSRELDAIREQVLVSRGERDAAYIRKVIDVQRRLELASRAVLMFSMYPPAWIIGTVGLTVAKILENTEIGHNVMHGQWDWMRDPKIHSTTWEWDLVMPAELWKHAHNEVHHRYTNVIGHDKDLGYGYVRVDEDQPWRPLYLGQPLWWLIQSVLFQYGMAWYGVDSPARAQGPEGQDLFSKQVRALRTKAKRQTARDYLLYPILSGPSVVTTFAANLVADLVRNLWESSVIMCGHFPEGVETFDEKSLENESRGQWYLRQILGSANFTGGRLLYLMTGNLSFQIEHHLYPDLPSNRYREIAPKVQELCERYGLTYTTGPFPRQLASAWGKVLRLSLPNNFLSKTSSALTPATLVARLAGKENRAELTAAA